MKKKLLSLIVVAVFVVSLTACTNKNHVGGDYTYNTYTTSLASNWNPHAWETNADSSVLGYITTPFVSLTVKDSENGIYQWSYEAATKIEDVTAKHQEDLTTYSASLPTGVTSVKDVEEGYVFEITLNKDLCWEDGTKIDADTYMTSIKHLLDPEMKNYRANLYISGESAVAGAYNYYYSKTPGVYTAVDVAGYESNAAAQAAGQVVYLNMWDFWGLDAAKDADGNACPQWVDVTSEVLYQDPADGSWVSASDIYGAYGASYLEVGCSYASDCSVYQVNEKVGYTWEDGVGVYKVSKYVIRYVCQSYIDFNYFLTAMTDNWLVYESLYVGGYDTTGELKTTTYGSSMATSMSYGPYKISSIQESKQMVYVQNPTWYGYVEQKDGSLYSETEFEVDGKKIQQYQCTKVVIDVMTDAAAKQSFLSGDLDEWAPSSDELSTYALSSQLYQVYETYTMSFFFNTDVDDLKTMDTSKGNTNSVVLSNINFRNAFSLAINRTEWVTKTQGYATAYSLLNSLYYYNVYEDPTSIYRNSDEAMQAIVNLYGVEYGEGKAYATLKEAYQSITGYNLAEAKALMKTACEELVAAGLYKAGDPIVINIGYKKGALDSDDTAQVQLMQKYLNAAVEGSGFGTVTLTPVGNISNRYSAVPNGDYAIGYGAWGGAAFYPFRNFQVYMDPDQYSINEGADWDPTKETFTLTFPNDSAKYGDLAGKEVTKTYQAWSNCMTGTGEYASANFSVKLYITAQLEEKYLGFYYRIPLATSTSCFLLSYKTSYYTENYNIMYDFGGFRLMKFNYNDTEWAKFVSENAVNGVLDYE